MTYQASHLSGFLHQSGPQNVAILHSVHTEFYATGEHKGRADDVRTNMGILKEKSLFLWLGGGGEGRGVCELSLGSRIMGLPLADRLMGSVLSIIYRKQEKRRNTKRRCRVVY